MSSEVMDLTWLISEGPIGSVVDKEGMRTFRPRTIRSRAIHPRTIHPRTIHPMDCSSQIVPKMLFNCLVGAGLMKYFLAK